MEKYGSSETICHDGIVQKTDTDSITAKIASFPACTGCHAEGFCSLSGKEDKIVQVAGGYDVHPGDTVTVLMKLSTGYSAVLMGYISPLCILILVLLLLISLSMPELIAGLSAVAALIPYYFILYLFRSKIGSKFRFTLKTR